MSVQPTFYQCQPNSVSSQAQKKCETDRIHCLYRKICDVIPSDLQSKARFGEKITVTVSDAATATALVKRVNEFSCESESTFFSGLLPRAHQSNSVVTIKFQHCIADSER